MKYLFLSLFSVALLFQSHSQVSFIHQDLNKGIELAKKDKRYIMVDVTADWCSWCKKMDATTFKNKDVGEFVSKNLVAVKINTQKEGGRAFADKHGVRGLPTIVYLDYEGNLMKSVPGYKTAKQLLLDLKPYELKREASKEKTASKSSYFDLKKSRLGDLEESLINSNNDFAKAFSFGKQKKQFGFDQFKYTRSDELNSGAISFLDVFYSLGYGDFSRASDKFSSLDDFSFLGETETELLVYFLSQNNQVNNNLLQLINEKTVKTSNLFLLENKVLVQYLLGDGKDAKNSLKTLKKAYKKQKRDFTNSVVELEKLVLD